jgi:hypothetical protein
VLKAHMRDHMLADDAAEQQWSSKMRAKQQAQAAMKRRIGITESKTQASVCCDSADCECDGDCGGGAGEEEAAAEAQGDDCDCVDCNEEQTQSSATGPRMSRRRPEQAIKARQAKRSRDERNKRNVAAPLIAPAREFSTEEVAKLRKNQERRRRYLASVKRKWDKLRRESRDTVQNTRQHPDTWMSFHSRRPPFHDFGNANVRPTNGGLVYGEYLLTHNVAPETAPNKPKSQQCFSSVRASMC